MKGKNAVRNNTSLYNLYLKLRDSFVRQIVQEIFVVRHHNDMLTFYLLPLVEKKQKINDVVVRQKNGLH